MQATIRNDFLTLTVDTHGAEAVSVQNAQGQEMLWQGDKSVWGRHAPILFPWTGKLAGGILTHAGKSYKGGQHGFARDLEHTLLSDGPDAIRLELRSDEQTKTNRFPYDFVLESTFRLDGKTVCHTLTVTCPETAAEPLPFGIGYHPAFAVPFDSQPHTTDYEFRFRPAREPGDPGLPGPTGFCRGGATTSGRTHSPSSSPTSCLPTTVSAWRDCAAKRWASMRRTTGRSVTCRIAGFPYTLIWSAKTDKVRFVCIEPWHSLPAAEADGPSWSKRAAAAILEPGQQWQTTLFTTFDR